MLKAVEFRLSMSDDRSMHTGVRDSHIRIRIVARQRIQMSLDHFGSPTTIFCFLLRSIAGCRCISSEILTHTAIPMCLFIARRQMGFACALRVEWNRLMVER